MLNSEHNNFVIFSIWQKDGFTPQKALQYTAIKEGDGELALLLNTLTAAIVYTASVQPARNGNTSHPKKLHKLWGRV